MVLIADAVLDRYLLFCGRECLNELPSLITLECNLGRCQVITTEPVDPVALSKRFPSNANSSVG